MRVEYIPKGTCSRAMTFEIVEEADGKRIRDLQITGGCNGNKQGISKLVEGMLCDEVISRLEGIRCGMKSTSCPDQLAQAIKEAIK